jgi:Arc/MetJ family transcription regulator
MPVRRKSHNLDEALLRRARRALGAATETDTIHEALRSVLVGEQALAELKAISGRKLFRDGFLKARGRAQSS